MGIGRKKLTRRGFLSGVIAAAAAPYLVPGSALGLQGRPSPSNRITLGCVGMGGQGTGDMAGFLGFNQLQVVAVCDVRKDHRDRAKGIVDKKYGQGSWCTTHADFRELTARPDIEAVLIATPDHWHAVVAGEAMRSGKDVYCEKPESLTVHEGRTMVETARRLSRVFSGGSQRVWDDYNQLHRWVRSGAIGDVKEVYVDVGGPSEECNLPEQPVPEWLDWDMWLGPAPWAPFNEGRLNFRPWRDYSGGGMTDWGCHGFGGALFACNLHETGPVEIIPPNGKDVPRLTYVFANGTRMYHGRGKSGNILHFVGTQREVPGPGAERPPAIDIPNYKGKGGIFGDFLHCVRSRERPFRDIELGHRTATTCHLGNIAYRLGRALKWDPAKEEIIGDAEATRLLSRAKRGPWQL